jgi:YVTN family beta-propeller protein
MKTITRRQALAKAAVPVLLPVVSAFIAGCRLKYASDGTTIIVDQLGSILISRNPGSDAVAVPYSFFGGFSGVVHDNEMYGGERFLGTKNGSLVYGVEQSRDGNGIPTFSGPTAVPDVFGAIVDALSPDLSSNGTACAATRGAVTVQHEPAPQASGEPLAAQAGKQAASAIGGSNIVQISLLTDPPSLIATIPLGSRIPSLIYQPSSGTDVYVIDGSALVRFDQNGERGSVAIGTGFLDLRATDDYVIASSLTQNGIAVFDRELNFLGSIQVQGAGRLAVGPDATAWVIGQRSAGSSVIQEVNLQTRTAGRTVVSGLGTYAMVYRDRSATLQATNTNENTVSVIDVATMQLRTKIAVGNQPKGIS